MARMLHVVHLEVERVLQVARLLVGQPGHDGCPLGDADDLEVMSFGQRAGDFADVPGGRYLVRLRAQGRTVVPGRCQSLGQRVASLCDQ